MTATAPTTPPLPELGNADELMQAIDQRFSETMNWREQNDITENLRRMPARRIQGENGWSATLFGNASKDPAGNPESVYALEPILHTMGEWWERAVRDAVLGCPEPEGARRQTLTWTGRAVYAKTVRQSYRTGGLLNTTAGHCGTLYIDAELSYDGKAKPQHIVWPFDLQIITSSLAQAISQALGTVQPLRGQGRKPVAAWTPKSRQRRPATPPRLFMQHSYQK